MSLPLGLIVNPVAGMGGAVGLHGTDGADVLAKARSRGAHPKAPERARRALAVLANEAPGATIMAPLGVMGTDHLAGLDLTPNPFGKAPSGATDARDTKSAAEAMRGAVCALLVAGGDGTVRDVVSVVGLDTPVLGIPCGVKMQSGVFALSPQAAGRIAAALSAGSKEVFFRKAEVMDIDEDARRDGRIAARLYGYARVPFVKNAVQAAKAAPPLSDDAALDAACVETARGLTPGVTWLVGPGTTAKRVLQALGETGTLLGVDAVRDGRVIGRDLSEQAALGLAGDGPLGIVVGVTGGQGFVFGRGNQQIGAAAIKRALPDRLIILASEGKLAALSEPRLLVDTGEPSLDRALEGFARVRTGPRRATLMRLCA
ncbi:MAG: NAD(+)/NADH kinase [Pseudomonadota bacterium]